MIPRHPLTSSMALDERQLKCADVISRQQNGPEFSTKPSACDGWAEWRTVASKIQEDREGHSPCAPGQNPAGKTSSGPTIPGTMVVSRRHFR